jgi:hypothetical protein
MSENYSEQQKWIEGLKQAMLDIKAEQVKQYAETEALEEIVLDIWSRTRGIEVEKLKKVLEERKKYWHDKYLMALENTNPYAAGALDHREIGDFPEPD